MKKYILCVVCCMVVTLPAAAQYLMPPHWKEAIDRNVSEEIVKHSHQEMSSSLLLKIPVKKQYFHHRSAAASIDFKDTAALRQLQNIPSFTSTTGCKAYALDDNWVMAGGTCMWNGRHFISFTKVTNELKTGWIRPDDARTSLHINGEKIPWEQNLFIQPHETTLPHVILVHVPAGNPLAAKLKDLPKVSVMGFKNLSPFHLPRQGMFFVHTARMGLNTLRQRELEPGSLNWRERTVAVEQGGTKLSGVSTDPLFFAEGANTYWIGANDGVTQLYVSNVVGDWDGLPSKRYFYFTQEDLSFIESVLKEKDPAAWERISGRLFLDRIPWGQARH